MVGQDTSPAHLRAAYSGNFGKICKRNRPGFVVLRSIFDSFNFADASATAMLGCELGGAGLGQRRFHATRTDVFSKKPSGFVACLDRLLGWTFLGDNFWLHLGVSFLQGNRN